MVRQPSKRYFKNNIKFQANITALQVYKLVITNTKKRFEVCNITFLLKILTNIDWHYYLCILIYYNKLF